MCTHTIQSTHTFRYPAKTMYCTLYLCCNESTRSAGENASGCFLLAGYTSTAMPCCRAYSQPPHVGLLLTTTCGCHSVHAGKQYTTWTPNMCVSSPQTTHRDIGCNAPLQDGSMYCTKVGAATRDKDSKVGKVGCFMWCGGGLEHHSPLWLPPKYTTSMNACVGLHTMIYAVMEWRLE